MTEQPNPGEKKDDLREVRHWSINPVLNGHIFVFGRIGSGKTCKLLTIVQAYHALGYKVWDEFGGKRGEGPFWALPNDDHSLWEQLEKETNEFSDQGPKQYKVKLLYIMWVDKLPKELPQHLPHVTSCVIPVPVSDVEEEDVTLAIGPLGPKAKAVWQAVKKLPKTASGPDIEFLMDTKFPKRKGDALYTLFLKPAIDARMFSSATSDLVLDMVAEAEDRETVTVLCLDFVPERFKLFVMGYLMRKLFTLAIEDRIHKRNIAMFREASYFMKVQDANKSKEDTTSIFRNQIVDIARYGRSGVFLAMDTQDSSEVKGMIEGSEDLLGICEMPSPTSREVTCAPLKRDRRMNEAQIRYIATMPVHQICLVERLKRAVILKRVQPPRSKYFKSQYGNFYSLWRKEVNSWTPSAQFIQRIEAEYQRSEELLLAKRAKMRVPRDEDLTESDSDFEEDSEEVPSEEGGDNDGREIPGNGEKKPLTFNSRFY